MFQSPLVFAAPAGYVLSQDDLRWIAAVIQRARVALAEWMVRPGQPDSFPNPLTPSAPIQLWSGISEPNPQPRGVLSARGLIAPNPRALVFHPNQDQADEAFLAMLINWLRAPENGGDRNAATIVQSDARGGVLTYAIMAAALRPGLPPYTAPSLAQIPAGLNESALLPTISFQALPGSSWPDYTVPEDLWQRLQAIGFAPGGVAAGSAKGGPGIVEADPNAAQQIRDGLAAQQPPSGGFLGLNATFWWTAAACVAFGLWWDRRRGLR